MRLLLFFVQPFGATKAENGYHDEADEGENETAVHGGVSANGTEIDDATLEWRQDGAAYDGHDEECCTEHAVLGTDILKRNAIDGGEHQTHKCTDADEEDESCHADKYDGSYRAERGTDGEDGQKLA